jgi:hypothetical protein
VQVVAGHVFHHAAAALRPDAVARDEFDSEQEIPRGAVELPERRIDSARHRAPDRRLIRKRRGQRQQLPVACK